MHDTVFLDRNLSYLTVGYFIDNSALGYSINKSALIDIDKNYQ